MSREVGLSHREIAEILGISHSRVQQIEAIAIAKLRRVCESRGWSLEDVLCGGTHESSAPVRKYSGAK